MNILGFPTGHFLTDLVLIVVVLAILLYVVGTWNHDHFTKRNLPFLKPIPFLGSMAPVVFFRSSFSDFVQKVYSNNRDTPFFGMFEFFNPVIILKDPELIKTITVKEFDRFMDHRSQITEEADPLFGKNLFALKGQRWRDMRSTLSPAFTSSKMKGMFTYISQCGKQIADYLDKEIKLQENGKMYQVELKDFFTRFTNDVIATSAFGLHCDSLKQKDNVFYKMGKDITDFSGTRSLIFLGYMLSPKLMTLLKIPFTKPKIGDFFRSLVHGTIDTREREGIIRPDMIHLLMQARKGELTSKPGEDEAQNGELKTAKTPLTDDDITAQAVVFFLAGFDTASTLLCFASHQMAVHPEIQERLQEEIDAVMKQDSQVQYDSIQKMKYLDMVLSETLRLYPPAVFIDRRCVKTYTIPKGENNPEYIIRKGDGVWIPISGLHHDPEHFPEPDKFDPERFSDENKHNIKPYTYLPFGAGPRLCIGQRFALMESKLALVHLLSRFTLKVVERTPIPIKLTKKGLNVTVDGGFWMGIEPRNK